MSTWATVGAGSQAPGQSGPARTSFHRSPCRPWAILWSLWHRCRGIVNTHPVGKGNKQDCSLTKIVNKKIFNISGACKYLNLISKLGTTISTWNYTFHTWKKIRCIFVWEKLAYFCSTEFVLNLIKLKTWVNNRNNIGHGAPAQSAQRISPVKGSEIFLVTFAAHRVGSPIYKYRQEKPAWTNFIGMYLGCEISWVFKFMRSRFWVGGSSWKKNILNILSPTFLFGIRPDI